jgi:Tol biopolymer transport system component
MSVRILVVALVGCGRIGFDVPGSQITVDAPADATTCTGFGPWSTPVAVTELDLATENEYGPALLPDGLTLYFNSDRLNNLDVFVATRPSRTAPFGAPVQIALQAMASNDDPTVTADELDLYFWTNATGCIHHAQRAQKADAFGSPTTVFCMAAGPFITSDGLTLYYNSPLDAASEGDLYVTTRASRDVEFTPGAAIPELAGGGRGFPSLTADGLSMYFEQATAGPLDLMETHRASPTSPWDPPVAMDALNSPAEDGDAGISPDGTEMFFESMRGAGLADLYHATRACL